MLLLIQNCYIFFNDYSISIILFTFLTKLFLFPITLWTHRNSLKMVSLMPALNRLTLKYYGDKDQIAEETQHLYKQEGYHPFLSTVPMFIQLALLIGVIGAVRELLAGTESILSVYPSQVGGITLLMPLAAGGSALLLGLAQNCLSPLQREQTKASQWTTNGVSIAISLMLGAFVPMGVGVYWIASNLLTIAQQLLLNAVMPPEKYVDYGALAESRKELNKLNSLSAKVSPEDKRREKADYMRFFSVANKHLVFYSERSGFYKYFENIIQYLLSHSNVVIYYVTSDPRDAIFEKAQAQPRIKPYYIGEKRLITLMMKMDADVVVMTMTDLENFHIKRSYVRKDIEYVYVFHAPLSYIMTLREGALDHYDTILCTGKGQVEELRKSEALYHLPEKRVVECGYSVIENMREHYLAHRESYAGQGGKKILVAPSWQEDNILDSCLEPMLKSLVREGWQVIVRPHPEYLKRYTPRWNALRERYQEIPEDKLYFQSDFSSHETVYSADVLISDWSGIVFEYAFSTSKPVLSIDTPMKVANPNYGAVVAEPLNLSLRGEIGARLPMERAGEAGAEVEWLLEHTTDYERRLGELRDEYLYNMGRSGEAGGRYILRQLKERGAKKKAPTQEKEKGEQKE